MENKNIRFCGCTPSQKNNIEPHANFTGSDEKKCRGIGWTLRYTEYRKIER